MKERAALFGREELVGIVSQPSRSTAEARPAVLILNSGIVHRVGPGRLSVRLARRLCEAGHLVARFDHAGIGDSEAGRLRENGRHRSTWREATVAEAREVMDELARTHGVQRFVLVGLCAGAATSLDTAVADPRVVGTVLMNPQGLDADPAWNAFVRSRGWARDYWKHSLTSSDSWWRALTGRVGYARLARVLWTAMRERFMPPPRVTAVSERIGAELRALVDRDARLLFLFTDDDHGLDYFDAITTHQLEYLRSSGRLETATIPRSDHTFTLLANQADVLQRVTAWMGTEAHPARESG